MVRGLNKAIKCHAVQERDKKYDGIFYFAAKDSGVYCRPSCAAVRSLHEDITFFVTVKEAKSHGYQACKRCHPDRLKNGLSLEILDRIDDGAINDQGVQGLADSLDISERHLRRIVHDRTGTSPLRLNKSRRLAEAKMLITHTKLPITDIAFNTEFSSLRQFNDVFKQAFNVSPSEMRKAAH